MYEKLNKEYGKDISYQQTYNNLLARAKELGIKMHLLIETEDAISKILSSKHFRYDKASKINPKSFMSMFLSICNRYDINVWYVSKKDSSRLIHDVLYYYCKEYLKNMEW